MRGTVTSLIRAVYTRVYVTGVATPLGKMGKYVLLNVSMWSIKISVSDPNILLLNCPQNAGNCVSKIFRAGHAPGPPRDVNPLFKKILEPPM